MYTIDVYSFFNHLFVVFFLFFFLFVLTKTVNYLKKSLIQSIPSKKAEPFKRWLAQVGKERLDEIENPELAQERMKEIYEVCFVHFIIFL
jgi:hypothetical protein